MTPQEIYLSDANRKQWYTETFQSGRGEEAMHAVFTAYVADLPGAVDGGTAIALNAKRQGAWELVERMRRFTLPVTPPPRPKLDQPLIDTNISSGANSPVRKQKP